MSQFSGIHFACVCIYTFYTFRGRVWPTSVLPRTIRGAALLWLTCTGIDLFILSLDLFVTLRESHWHAEDPASPCKSGLEPVAGICKKDCGGLNQPVCEGVPISPSDFEYTLCTCSIKYWDTDHSCGLENVPHAPDTSSLSPRLC